MEPHEEVVSTVKRGKFRWYGDVSGSLGLAKTVLQPQGTAPGGRKRGRQRNRWEHKTPEWIGLKLRDAVRESEEREGRWKLVTRPSVGAP